VPSLVVWGGRRVGVLLPLCVWLCCRARAWSALCVCRVLRVCCACACSVVASGCDGCCSDRVASLFKWPLRQRQRGGWREDRAVPTSGIRRRRRSGSNRDGTVDAIILSSISSVRIDTHSHTCAHRERQHERGGHSGLTAGATAQAAAAAWHLNRLARISFASLTSDTHPPSTPTRTLILPHHHAAATTRMHTGVCRDGRAGAGLHVAPRAELGHQRRVAAPPQILPQPRTMAAAAGWVTHTHKADKRTGTRAGNRRAQRSAQ